ncbi:MAG: elongator complex 1-like [Trebouxia sp. A1-2]|nr:MAG: elongator complex 1-like [Trebouxia sp. A1-2]
MLEPFYQRVLWTRNLRESLEDTSDDVLGPHSHVAGVAYLQELVALCITATGGEILLVQGPREVQEVGKLQEGIICSAWSPDQEFLAICTGTRQLVLMNKVVPEWEVLAEDSMDAVLEPEDEVPSDLGSDVASSLRVWQTEGCALHAVGKASAVGLYTVLAWQPNGRHLYAAHAQGNHHRVVLYETNGLEHGGFDVPRSGRLTQLSWSTNSELLAVVLTDAAAVDKQGNADVVQIWHRSNWHWYLKQEQVYTDGQGVRVSWDEVAALRLHVASGAGWYRQVDLAMERTVSSSGTAAVVDGATLLLTPLQRALVPPPMCAVAAVFPHPMQCLAFGNHQGNEVVAGVTSSNELTVVQAKEGDLWEPTTEAELDDMETKGIQQAVIQPHTVALAEPLAEGAIIRSIVWLTGSSSLLVIGTPLPGEGGGEQEHRDILQRLSISWSNGTERPTATATKTGRASGCIRIAEAAAHAGALLQMQDGSMWTYASRDDEGLIPCGPGELPSALPLHGEESAPAVGLSEGGQLYWGSAPIQSACTSVAVRGQGPGGPFLLYTTRDNMLHTLPFALLGLQTAKPAQLALKPGMPANKGLGAGKYDNLYTAMHAAMRPQGAQGARDVTIRAVEQGARLLAAPPLGVHEYGEAFELTSNNRVDLNVIVDYAWPQFLVHATDFVREVEYDQDIVDLLTSLKKESVTSEGGMYAAAMPPPPSTPQADTSLPNVTDAFPSDQEAGQQDVSQANKIELVAKALRAALLASPGGQGRFLKPILATFAVVGDLEGALGIIKEVKERQLAADEGTPRGGEGTGEGSNEDDGMQLGQASLTAEQGLKHLLLTVDVERLYRQVPGLRCLTNLTANPSSGMTALGMYDVQLAYMVVAHSQRDPGEYLMELQQLVKAPTEGLRRHAMDVHLGRFDRALHHLVHAGQDHFPKALQLARTKESFIFQEKDPHNNQGLLRELLQLVGDRAEARKAVLGVYGEVLSQRNMQEDSALAFTAAQDLPRALEAYKVAGHWQMALTLAGRLGWQEAQVKRLAAELVDGLSSLGNLAGAAAVAVHYLADLDNGVTLLTQAREWREALRLAYKHGRDDLVDTVIAPASAEAVASTVSDVREERERVSKYLTRLKEVRHKRSAMQAALAADDEEAQPSGRDFDDTASEASSAVSGMSAYQGSTTTGTSSVTGSSGRPASTVGGKRPHKRKQKKDKSGRIRQGSPEEERALGQHIAALAPSTKQLTEAGQLAELLTLLGHEADARVLQQQLSSLVTEQQAAQQFITDNPPPEVSTQQKQQTHHTQNATAKQGATSVIDWKWDILRPVTVPSPPG